MEEIAALAGRWARFREENNPGLNLTDGELEELKKNSVTAPASGFDGGC